MPLFEIERVSRFLLTLGLPRVRELPPAQAAELMEWAWEEDDRQSGAEGTIRVLAIVASCVGVLVCAVAFTFDFSGVGCPECGTPVTRDVRIILPPEVPDRVT